jgi:DNA-binding transcriptional LysR family regulator
MNLDTLRVYCDIVSCQSFSRGAALNNVTQSAASQAVHQLERHLAVQLLDRSKRPFLVTPAGQTCYETFRQILGRFDSLSSQLRSLSLEVTGLVRVAANYSLGLHELTKAMQEFMRRHTNATIRLEYLRPNKVYEAVLHEEADLGVISYPESYRGLAVIPLREENMILVCHPDHRLARLRRVTTAQLRGEKYVAFDHDLPIRRAIDRYLQADQVTMEVAMEFDNIETIKQAVEIGAGLSILPEPTVRQEIANKTLVAVPFAIRKLKRPIGIIHRERKLFTLAATRFIELLRETPAGGNGGEMLKVKPGNAGN